MMNSVSQRNNYCKKCIGERWAFLWTNSETSSMICHNGIAKCLLKMKLFVQQFVMNYFFHYFIFLVFTYWYLIFMDIQNIAFNRLNSVNINQVRFMSLNK